MFNLNKKNKIYLWIPVFSGIVFALYFLLFFHKASIQPMEISFSPSNVPLIEIDIDGTLYPIALDLGSKFQLSLNKEILEKINKKPNGIAKWRDAKGDFYESRSFLIPKIKIGDLSLTDVSVSEESENFVANTTIWDNTASSKNFIQDKVGALGRPILEKFNLLLDFAHSKIILCNDTQKLKEFGFSLENMTPLPLKKGRGLIFTVTTDIGEKQFDLDTGSTLNLARTSLFQNVPTIKKEYGLDTYTTSRFIIGKKDFGKVTFYLYDICSELHEIDGCLGMRFLKNHLIYIDYQNQVVYIGDSL